MADKKISQLTAATLPFDGTEVLPIVQSSTTLKVSVNDLAAGNVKSQSTTGVLQVSGPGAGTTRVMTVPNANFTAARTDAAQSFTGDQTLSTGNLIQGTSAKGVNFTANTPAAGMTSQLLNWYETGTFTPTVSGTTTPGAATYTIQVGSYIRIGNQVQFQISLGWSAHTGTGNFANIAGLPFTSASTTNNYSIPSIYTSDLALTAGNVIQGFIAPSATSIALRQVPTGGGTAAVIALDTAVSLLLVTGTYTV